MTVHDEQRHHISHRGRFHGREAVVFCADVTCAAPVRRAGDMCSRHGCWYGARLVPHVHEHGGPIVTDCIEVVPLRRSA